SSRRRHTRFSRDWSADVCSSDLCAAPMDGFMACLESTPARHRILPRFERAQMLTRLTAHFHNHLPQLIIFDLDGTLVDSVPDLEIGRASCRGSGTLSVGGGGGRR